jgi:hypothetical protein
MRAARLRVDSCQQDSRLVMRKGLTFAAAAELWALYEPRSEASGARVENA